MSASLTKYRESILKEQTNLSRTSLKNEYKMKRRETTEGNMVQVNKVSFSARVEKLENVQVEV